MRIEHGDMREVLRRLLDDGVRVQAVISDPPYGLAFMGRKWDDPNNIAFQMDTWRLCWEMLPPGGHLLAFGGTRTFHRLVCAIEDAGFEIRDTIGWLFGSGFPKSHNVGKAIDKAAGVEREVIERVRVKGGGTEHINRMNNRTHNFRPGDYQKGENVLDVTAPATDAARQWEGWGTALKPAAEYVCWAQKPYTEQQQNDIISSKIGRLEHCIWSLLPANAAVEIFKLSQSEFDAECTSAPWNAGERSNTQAALSAQMDTSQFVSAILSSLSTVKSWRQCLADLSQLGNTSTTETASSTTIDLETWKSCLSRITPASIIQAHSRGAWSSADAGPAERYLNACASRWSATRELSALESVLGSDATSYPDAGVISPNLELICLARKPLIGTVAANVQAHGTGALNIDGCRIDTNGEDLGDPSRFLASDKNLNDGWQRPHKSDTDKMGKRADDRFTRTASLGRWPANVCLSYPEDEYVIRPDATAEEKAELFRWLSENT